MSDAVAFVLIAVVALIHIYVVLLEMVWWDSPRGRKAFGTTESFARETRVLAANQGLYNGFLAAGLIWSLVHPDPGMRWQIAMFFLGCVAVAGIFGAVTTKSRRILLVQAVPAVLGIVALAVF
jgi:putative membrane protein